MSRMRGRCRLVRCADDALLLLATEWDVRRVLDVPGKRPDRYGLVLHPTKTRFVDFRLKYPGGHDGDANFDFLNFTHVCAKSRKGYPEVRCCTAKGRFARALKSVSDWCRHNRHRPQTRLSRELC